MYLNSLIGKVIGATGGLDVGGSFSKGYDSQNNPIWYNYSTGIGVTAGFIYG